MYVVCEWLPTNRSNYSSRWNVASLLGLMSWFTKIVFLFFFYKVSISIIFLFELIINHYTSIHNTYTDAWDGLYVRFGSKAQSTSNKFLFCFNNFLKISNNPSYHRIIIHMSVSVLNHLKSLKRTQTFHIFRRPHYNYNLKFIKQFFFGLSLTLTLVTKVIRSFFESCSFVIIVFDSKLV